MAFGTWRSPFPRRFGGGSVERVSRMYDRIRSNLGTAVSDDAASVADIEAVAAARLLSLADRAIERRVRQGQDPRLLTEPLLSRKEVFLGIVPSVNDSDQVRRRRVSAILLSGYDALAGSISVAVAEAFAPWTTQQHYNNAATAVAHWPGSSPSEPSAWTSTVALVTVEYVRPYNASDADAQRRVDACQLVLDDVLPAWMAFDFSETYYPDDYGFRVGVSRLGYATLTEP